MDINALIPGAQDPFSQGKKETDSSQQSGFKDLLQVISETKEAAKIDPVLEREQDKDLPDLDYIEKYGFTAFAEKMRQEKIEEMREKILKAMGLSEEMLEEMPAEQRAALENRITEEIERRLAAMAETKKQDQPQSDKIGSLTNALSTRPGMGDGAALLEMLEQQELVEPKLAGDPESEK